MACLSRGHDVQKSIRLEPFQYCVRRVYKAEKDPMRQGKYEEQRVVTRLNCS